MGPTITTPSLTTGIPEITPYPRPSPPSISQGTQTQTSVVNVCYSRPALLTGRLTQKWGWRYLYGVLPSHSFIFFIIIIIIILFFFILLATKNCFGVFLIYVLYFASNVYLCSKDGSCCYFSTANICLDTRSTSHCPSHNLQGVNQNLISEL